MMIYQQNSLIEGNRVFDIQVPSEIDFFIENEKHVRMHIKKPMANMQVDCAAFEGWAVLLHAKKGCNVTLSFEGLSCCNKKFVDLCNEKSNYTRFLYRVWKFNEQMGNWFDLDPENISTVQNFKK